MEEAERACRHLWEPPGNPVMGMARYQQAELLRLRGDLGRAELGYREAGEMGHSVQPGLDLLRPAQGKVEEAAATIRRVLAETDDLARRSRVLGDYVEVMLASGDVAAARAGADEMSEISAAFASPYLTAVAGQATGAVLLAEGGVRLRAPPDLTRRPSRLRRTTHRAAAPELGAAPDADPPVTRRLGTMTAHTPTGPIRTTPAGPVQAVESFEQERLALFRRRGFDGTGDRVEDRSGRRTYVIRRRGGSPRVVLVHGGLSEASEWTLLAGRLAGDRREAAEWFLDLPDGIGAGEPVDLVGNSMGGLLLGGLRRRLPRAGPAPGPRRRTGGTGPEAPARHPLVGEPGHGPDDHQEREFRDAEELRRQVSPASS